MIPHSLIQQQHKLIEKEYDRFYNELAKTVNDGIPIDNHTVLSTKKTIVVSAKLYTGYVSYCKIDKICKN